MDSTHVQLLHANKVICCHKELTADHSGACRAVGHGAGCGPFRSIVCSLFVPDLNEGVKKGTNKSTNLSRCMILPQQHLDDQVFFNCSTNVCNNDISYLKQLEKGKLLQTETYYQY